MDQQRVFLCHMTLMMRQIQINQLLDSGDLIMQIISIMEVFNDGSNLVWGFGQIIL